MLTNLPAYSMRVFWSENDQAFIAVCPELHDLSAFGATYEDAARELQTAITVAVEVLQEDGDAVPAPARIPEFSGQFRVRIPRSLHARLVADAEAEGVSLNTLVCMRLADASGAAAAAQRVVAQLTKSVEEMRTMLAAVASRRPPAEKSRVHVANASFAAKAPIGVTAATEYRGV